MNWRDEAYERLPEFRTVLEREDSPYMFLMELVDGLEAAYVNENDDLVRRIYEFAFLCVNAPRGKTAADDLLTAVACSFFEHLPQHKHIRQDIGSWFLKSDVLGMTETFHYHGTEKEFQEMLKSCDTKHYKRA